MSDETRQIHERMTAEGRTVLCVYSMSGIKPVQIAGYESHADTWQTVYYWAFKPYDIMCSEVKAEYYAKDND